MLADARVVVFGSVVTQLGGFAKTVLIAHLFGASAALDGYYLALVIPTLLVGLIGGALQVGFVPTYLRVLQGHAADDPNRLVKQLLTLMVATGLPLCIVMSLFAAPLMSLVVLSQSVVDEAAVSAFRVVVFVLLLNVVADFLALILNSHKRFFLGAFSPLANVVVSMAILQGWHAGGQDALTFGLLAGVATQIGVLVAGVGRAGVSLGFARPALDPALRRVLSLGSAILVGTVLANLNLAVDQVMASMLGEGAVSTIGYANRFHGFVVQALIMGLGTVLLPYLSQLVIDQRFDSVRELFIHLAPLLLFCAIGVPIFLVVAGVPSLQLVLGHGALTEMDIVNVASIWFWYAVGLLPMAWGVFLARYFQASSKPGFITRLAGVSLVANIVFNLAFIGPLGLDGLALSTSLSYLLVAALYHRRFAREVGFKFGAITVGLLVMLGVAAVYLTWAFPPSGSIGSSASHLGAGLIVVLAAIPVLRVREAITVLKHLHD